MSHDVVTFAKALGGLSSDERYGEVMRHGRVHAGIYAPHHTDDQEPHDQDEFYVVLNGSGFLEVGDSKEPFSPGDILFVEKGVAHKFVQFTPDLAVWAIFCDA